jgi:hypothetical protein
LWVNLFFNQFSGDDKMKTTGKNYLTFEPGVSYSGLGRVSCLGEVCHCTLDEITRTAEALAPGDDVERITGRGLRAHGEWIAEEIVDGLGALTGRDSWRIISPSPAWSDSRHPERDRHAGKTGSTGIMNSTKNGDEKMYTTENTTGYTQEQLGILNDHLTQFLCENGDRDQSEMEKLHSDLMTNGGDEEVLSDKKEAARGIAAYLYRRGLPVLWNGSQIMIFLLKSRCMTCDTEKPFWGPHKIESTADAEAAEILMDAIGSRDAHCEVCGSMLFMAMFVDGKQTEIWQRADIYEQLNGPEAGPLPPMPEF